MSSLINELKTKNVSDFFSENKKPESVNSGLINNSLDLTRSGRNGNPTTSILPDVSNLYKQNGISLENLGYFIIPRSVTSDPRYKNARLKYKHVLNVIFENVAFAPTTHAIGTEVIPISIGQFCVTIRGLAEICNQGVKQKEDKVDRNTIVRAIRFFEKCQFVRQEVRQGKSLITIIVPGFYDRNKKTSETTSETKARQERDTKEEYKEYKEDIISSRKQGNFVPSSFAISLLSEFYSSLFSSIPDFPKESVRKTKTQYQAADRIIKKANNDMDLIRKVIAYAHEPGGFWLSHVHSVTYLDSKFIKLVQQLRDQGKKPVNGQKLESLHNKSFKKDNRPVAYNNRLDFSGVKK